MRAFRGRLQYPIITNGEESFGVAQDTAQALTADQRQPVLSYRPSPPILAFQQGYSESAVNPNFRLSPCYQNTSSQTQRRIELRQAQYLQIDQSQLKKVEICVELINFRGQTTLQRVRLQKHKIIQQRQWRKKHPDQLIVPARLRFQEPHLTRTKKSPSQPNQKRKHRYRQARPEKKPICIAQQLLRKACTKTSASSKPLITIPKGVNDLNRQQDFLERRMTLQAGRIDLGVTSLFQIVQYAHLHHLLSNELYFQFVNQYTQQLNTDFIRSLSDHSLADWNFMAYKLTPADHRRIALLLARLYPGEFIIGKPLFLNKTVDGFMKLIYSVPISDYFNLMGQIDRKLKMAWWKPISIKHHRALAEIYTSIPPATLGTIPIVNNRLDQLSQNRPPFLNKNNQKISRNMNQQPRQRKLSEFYLKQQQEDDQPILKYIPTKFHKGC